MGGLAWVASIFAWVASVDFKQGCPCVTVNVTDCFLLLFENKRHCVSPEYGSGACRKWDLETPLCQDSSELFCQDRWCYVDPLQCRASSVEYSRSATFLGAPGVQGPLYFSYDTCGSNPDDWRKFRISSSLRAHLRVCLRT